MEAEQIVPFNPILATRKFRESGFEENQAEELSNQINNAVLGTVATKNDIVQFKSEIKSDIAEIKSDVDNLDDSLGSFRSETKLEFQKVREESKQEFKNVHEELKRDREETKREFKNVHDEFKRVREENKRDSDGIRRDFTLAMSLLQRDIGLAVNFLRNEFVQGTENLEEKLTQIRNEFVQGTENLEEKLTRKMELNMAKTEATNAKNFVKLIAWVVGSVALVSALSQLIPFLLSP